ncbi:MAG: hypothetical protein ACR2NM_12950, partial [Bythopirellula sp.]
DFGDGNFSANNSENAGLGNFIVAEDQTLGAAPGDLSQIIDGVEMTIRPIIATGADFGGSAWGSNTQGIGIRSNDSAGTTIEAGGSGPRRRVDGSIGEGIQFFFDTDVSLTSARLGSFASNGAMTLNETIEFTYVSGGTDPFNGGSLTFTKTDPATEPGTDMPLGGVFVTSGTILNLTTTAAETVGQGVLFNGLNVFVGTPPEPLTLQVDTGTGEMSLLNNSIDPIDIDYLRFLSEDMEMDGGSLAPGSYTGLAGAAGFPAGNNDGTGWEAADSNDDLEVIESFLTGMSTIPNDGQPISLGNAFVPGGTQDLSFAYHLAGEGAVETVGQIEYLMTAMTLFDANVDGTVNNDDIPDFVTALLNLTDWETLHPGLDPLLYLDGDGNSMVNNDDIPSFVAALLNPPFVTSSQSAVPEPGTFSLLAACALSAVLGRRCCRLLNGLR